MKKHMSTVMLPYLILDIICMGLEKISAENEIFQEFLEARLDVRREEPIRKPKDDMPF